MVPPPPVVAGHRAGTENVAREEDRISRERSESLCQEREMREKVFKEMRYFQQKAYF